jgi:ATP-dependent helicase/nuclease subunit B
MANPKPRVFTIPASAPFLPTLIDALVKGRLVKGFPAGGDPLALARATLYLPTRRACRVARRVFLEVLGAEAAVLPRLVALMDVDADEIEFAEAADAEFYGTALDLPKTLGGFERNVLLAELILAWARLPRLRSARGAPLVANSPAAAFALAGALARLMDDMTIRQVSWDKLDGLVPDDVDEYWQETLQFLKFMRERWPPILAERNLIEPKERETRLIAAEAERLARSNAPVIAAGSTGSTPATAGLLATIARLPHGAVVLPGLDTDLDAPSWELIAGDGKDQEPTHGHAQFAMQALLRRIGVVRAAVGELAPPASHGRERLISEALRPAESTELWQTRLAEKGFTAQADAAMASVTAIEAANAEEEALAVAVALRETAETPGKTAALVTPDRALARRVLAALARWQVPVDDSGGDALGDSPDGVFARLLAEAALKGLAPVTLLALLKHPRAKVDPWAVGLLERAILRGPRPKRGTAGLRETLTAFRKSRDALHRTDQRRQISDAQIDAAEALVAQLQGALQPLEELHGTQTFAAIAERHRAAVEALGKIDEMDKSLFDTFDDIADATHLAIAPADYAELFHATLAAAPRVRRREQDVRVRIFGPLEARLQSVDRMVIGGLVEGGWPPDTRADPWLSRPMRSMLGLDLPERRVGLSAHDFAQAMGAKEVILARAAKLAGAPTVASRFVQRLAAVAGEPRWAQAIARGERYLDWARALDRPALPPQPVRRPEPKPPLAARPKSLSVTQIELWLRDPYSIYARHILKLHPLDPVDTPPGARDRGTVVHGAIGDFTKIYKAALPADALAKLLALGQEQFRKIEEFPDAKAFWWPRFQRIARWFTEFETARRPGILQIDAELDGTLEIPLPGSTFTLGARADRIEHRSDGGYAILDYKTGRTATAKEIRSGLAPQLTLEGAILRQGCFGEIPKGASIAELMYVSIRGMQPPGEEKPIEWDDSSPDAEADRALAKLTTLVTRFGDEDTPYRSLERPMFLRRNAGDYDHLSRVKEWSLSAGAADPEDTSGGTE